MPPYTKGKSCSLCGKEDTCVKKLCGKQKGKTNNHKILFEEQSVHKCIIFQTLAPQVYRDKFMDVFIAAI